MLAPNPETIVTQLTSDYAVNSFLMAWSHTLMNTALHPIEPKPKWFDKISGALEQAKKVTRPWLLEEYPRIAAALPQSLIDYGNKAVPILGLLRPELAKARPDRQVLIELIDALRTEAREQQAKVLGLRDQVAAYSPRVAAVAREAAVQAQEVIASAGEANRKVLSLQSRIADLQRQLGVVSTEAKHAMSGAAATGASVTMTMMSFTVTAAIGTASFPVFGLVGAFIGIGINAALQAAKSQEVMNTLREIGQLSLELSAEQHQAAALRTIVQSLERLSDQSADAATSMVASLHHWEDICGDLDLLRDLLGQPALEPGRLLPLAAARLRAAEAAWEKIVEGAGKIQLSALQVTAPIEIRL